MLLSLKVSNMALIDNCEVSFSDGLNVFSGETGAGKSLVVGSVSMALGGRVKPDIQRDPGRPAEVELVFSAEEGAVVEGLKALGVEDVEDGTVIISRRINSRRSVNRVNGAAVSLSALREVAHLLIDIHGQSEHQSLNSNKKQLEILDGFAQGMEEVKGRYLRLYRKARELEEKIGAEAGDETSRLREADLLRFEISEIEGAALTPGEDERLEEKFTRMSNARKLKEAAGEAYTSLSGEDGAGELINRAVRAFAAVAALDSGSAAIAGQLEELSELSSDMGRTMREYLEGLDFSNEEYDNVSARLDAVNTLKHKYGGSIERILSSCGEKKQRLSNIEDFDVYMAGLRGKYEKAEKERNKAASELHELRTGAAAVLSERMRESLRGLNFQDVNFSIEVEDSASFGPEGADTVEFYISTNVGEPLKPLREVASGGELSRVMLSLKTVLAKSDSIDTLVFDEIDTGISGRTAQKVSESLLKLSRSRQVILITHLPQIAAMADHHFLIEKGVEEGRTVTHISELEGAEVIKELSRLLGGAEITEKVMENAREMKSLADEKKNIT